MSMPRRLAGIVALAGLALVPGVSTAAPVLVVEAGDESPTANFFYKDFRYLDVSDAPLLAFVGKTSNGAKPRQQMTCVWKVDETGVGTDLACVKDASPTGQDYANFRSVSMNASGATAWIAVLGESVARGVFHEGGRVSVTGDPIDQVNAANGTFSDYSQLNRLDSGGVVFLGNIAGVPDATNHGLFRCTPGADLDCGVGGDGTLTELVRKGDEVDDRPGRFLCQITQAAASNWGVAFRAATKTNCANPLLSTRTGVFRQAFGGSIVTVALEAEAANPEGVYDRVIAGPDVNNSGDVAFVGSTKLAGEEAGSRVYLCEVGTCPAAAAAVAVDSGDTVPSGGALTRFPSVAIKDDGAIVFEGHGRRFGGVYKEDGGITALVELGDDAPDSAEFKGIVAVAVSPGGSVAMQAVTRRTVRPRTTNEGLFLLE